MKKTITENELATLYQELNQLLSQIRSAPSPEISQQLLDKRKQIVELQREIEPVNWTYTKRKLFQDYEAEQVIGTVAANNLKNIFLQHQADPHSAQQEVQAIINKLNDLLQKVQSLKTSLGPLSEKYEQDTDQETLQLVFADRAEIDNLSDLESYAHKWQVVLHNVSRLVNEDTGPAKIQSIQKGSTILVINSALPTILALAFIVDKLINLYERILKLRKLSLEIENLKLNNETALKALRESEKKEIESEVEKIVEAVYKKHRKDNKKNDQNDIKNQLNSSVKTVYNFIVKGGRVEVNNYEQDDEESAENLQFEPKYNQIKAMIEKYGNIELLDEPQKNLEERKPSNKPTEPKKK